MMKNKLLIIALVFGLNIPAIVLTEKVEASSTFTDVPINFSYKKKMIDVLVENGVISGFSDGTFKPYTKVTRGQFALFISKALELPTPKNIHSFPDVGKNSAVYNGVVKANAAGIISGYSDGRFKPDEFITRGDMAIMLDRALQYRASFTNKLSLSYDDKSSIGSSALEAVQRLSNYNIMGALKGYSFEPKTQGDRISTVVSIYQLMDTKSLIEDGIDVYPKGDVRNYSYPELVKRLGEWEVLKRANPDGSIYVIDVIAEMQLDYSNLPEDAPALRLTPEEHFETYRSAFTEASSLYASYYPLGEYVTIKGVPFRETEFYPDFLANPDPMYLEYIRLNNVIPNPPKESGKFLIDLPSSNKDIVTYHSKKVDIEHMSKVPQKTTNNDYLVDVKSLFRDTKLVTVSFDGLTIQHNDKSINLQMGSNKATINGQAVILTSNVVSENGVVLVPFKSISNHIGIYWREMDFSKRFELANYPLDQNAYGWEGYEGWSWEE